MTEDKNSKFINSALILTLGGLIVKILGALYKVPLANILGEVGAGYQGFAYPYYNFFNSILIAGFPVGIAKLVSEYSAKGDEIQSEKVFIATRRLMMTLGIILSITMFVFTPILASHVNMDNTKYTLQSMSIAVFFISITYSFKGYFQGRQYLRAYALADVVEQAIKVVFGLGLVAYSIKYGAEYASAISALSIGISVMVAAVLLVFLRRRYTRKRGIVAKVKIEFSEYKEIYKRVLMIAIPITIGTVIITFVNLIEGAIVISRLQSVGMAGLEAGIKYGYYSYYSASIVNFPQILFAPVSVAIFPVIASLIALNKLDVYKKVVNVGIKVVLFISLPCGVGLYLLSSNILEFLWPAQLEMIIHTAPILQIMSFMLVALSLYGITSAILNGIGKPHLPSINLILGAITRLFICYYLTTVDGIGYLSAPIGSLASFGIGTILNFLSIYKHSKVKFNLTRIFFKPIVASASMGIVVYLSLELLSRVISGRVLTLLIILIGVLSYLLFLVIYKCIGEEEMEFLPGKKILSRIFK